MDLDTLREFANLYETLRFQETADRLCVSQSALIKHIHKLGEELGIFLFDRSTRSVRPNVFSETFSPYAEQIVRTDEEARRALKDLGKSRKAHLRLAFPSTCSQYGIAEIISTFAKLSPSFTPHREEHPRLRDTQKPPVRLRLCKRRDRNRRESLPGRLQGGPACPLRARVGHAGSGKERLHRRLKEPSPHCPQQGKRGLPRGHAPHPRRLQAGGLCAGDRLQCLLYLHDHAAHPGGRGSARSFGGRSPRTSSRRRSRRWTSSRRSSLSCTCSTTGMDSGRPQGRPFSNTSSTSPTWGIEMPGDSPSGTFFPIWKNPCRCALQGFSVCVIRKRGYQLSNLPSVSQSAATSWRSFIVLPNWPG